MEAELEQFASLPDGEQGRSREELLSNIQAEVTDGPPLNPDDLYDEETGLPR